MLNSIFLFLNLGGGEVFMIVLVVLMLFGSDKLPEIAKGLGKGLREINDAKDQIQNEISKSTEGFASEIRKHTSEIQSEIEKAGESMKRQMDDVGKVIADEGKNMEDTMK
ncbi:MAG: Sec-independent protein secretion pathway component [Bacteroidetes bacterium]|nr:Sec-independent protein secretion pathway component [Bacteroidota bacterium]